MTVVDLALQIAFSVLVTAGIVRWDSRRLSPERYARSWNSASFWSAVVGFGPLCIPVHFARTRRSLLGLGLGLVVMVAAFAANGLLGSAIDAALPKAE